MRNSFDARRFAAFVRTKRGEQSLREAAAEIGTVSPATLLRLEREEVPDIETFLHVCDWLEMAPREFLASDEAEERMSTLERIELVLRADGVLGSEVIEAFITIAKAVRSSRSS
jgi:transcriptional regulator with XRE-family HTH domain